MSHIDVLHEEAYMLFYVRRPKPAVRLILSAFSSGQLRFIWCHIAVTGWEGG